MFRLTQSCSPYDSVLNSALRAKDGERSLPLPMLFLSPRWDLGDRSGCFQHDTMLIDLADRFCRTEYPSAHNCDSIADSKELGQVAAYHQNRFALACKLINDPVDFSFRANIH